MDWVILTTIICIALCFVISGVQVIAHLRDFHNPNFQKRIIVILLMPPIYALFSSLSIWLHDHKSYLLFIRDIYESIVIYNFFELLRAYVGYNEQARVVENEIVHQHLATKGEVHHSFPVNLWAKPMKLETHEDGKALLEKCEKGILQYIPIKIICALIDILDLWAWFWPTGNNAIYYTCSFVVSISVSVALYYLVLFFHVLYDELSHQSPLLKFLTIKGVLFLTFWQEMVLWVFSAPLAHARFIPQEDREDASETMSSVLVNIEMVIMTCLTAYAYSHKDFVRRSTIHQHRDESGLELLANPNA